MKTVFLVDNIPAIEMFAPIIRELPDRWEVLAINFEGWTRRETAQVEKALQEKGFNYKTVEGWSRRNVEKLLQQEAPGVVVLSRDTTTPLEQLFIGCANSMRIPTLLVPHGMWTPQARGNWGLRAAPAWLKHLYRLAFQGLRVVRIGGFSWGRLIHTGLFRLRRDLKRRPMLDGHGGCSKIAVLGNAMKEILISGGIGPEHIEVTGNPKFDSLYHAKESDCKSKVCGTWGLPGDHNIILLLTGYFVELGTWTAGQRKEFVMAIANAVAKLPRSKLVIKIHPVMESEADYLEITGDLPEPPIVCHDVSLPELLSACSLAITVGSTAGLEAMAMGKPLLVVDFFNDVTPFDEASGAIVVRNRGDLVPALEAVICRGLSQETKDTVNNYVYQQAYVQDGKAAKRIADLVVRMTQEAEYPEWKLELPLTGSSLQH